MFNQTCFLLARTRYLFEAVNVLEKMLVHEFGLNRMATIVLLVYHFLQTELLADLCGKYSLGSLKHNQVVIDRCVGLLGWFVELQLD